MASFVYFFMLSGSFLVKSGAGEFVTDLATDLAYKIVRVTFEQRKELIELSPLCKEITLETATVGLPIPLHPGAEKYFKEKGILK